MPQVEEPGDFTELYAAHRRQLESVARRVTNDADVAQDVVADAAIRVWRRLRSQAPDNPAGYLTAAVRNEALDHLRRVQRERGMIAALQPMPVSSNEESAVDDRDQVQRLLSTLTPVQRCTLNLRYRDGRSEAEIAEALGIPAGTVKSHAHRALLRLRTEAGTR